MVYNPDSCGWYSYALNDSIQKLQLNRFTWWCQKLSLTAALIQTFFGMQSLRQRAALKNKWYLWSAVINARCFISVGGVCGLHAMAAYLWTRDPQLCCVWRHAILNAQSVISCSIIKGPYSISHFPIGEYHVILQPYTKWHLITGDTWSILSAQSLCLASPNDEIFYAAPISEL